MLDPQTRAVLLETLETPEGFTLTQAIATTYSLDLITLVSTQLAFTQFEWEDAKGEITSNPVLLLEALRRNIDKLTVFCQQGRIAVPPRANPLFTYLENAIVEVKSPHPEGVFHPKVWVLRYQEVEERAVLYRLVCLSRNLTDNPSWDLSLMLEGPLVDRKNAFAVNHPLADFVAALPGLAARGASAEAQERAKLMSDELRRVDFASYLPEDVDGCAFWAFGIEGHRKDPFKGGWKKGLVISPFLDATKARRLAEDSEKSILVSRQEELEKLPKGALDDWETVYVLAPGAEGEREPDSEGLDRTVDCPDGLHAKMYLTQNGSECSLFVGSANATSAAFERNVEFMVELVGKPSKLGLEKVLAPGEGQASLLSLLQEYEPPAEPKDDALERQLEDLLEVARRAMASAGWEFHAGLAQPAGIPLQLRRGDSAPLAIPAEVEVWVWPVTHPPESSRRPVERGAASVDFAPASAATLTTFLACQLDATVSGRTQSCQFVLNIPLSGAPAGRREAVLRQVLDDPSKVLRFLQFLLSDDQFDPMADPLATPALSTGNGGRGAAGFVVLESLLWALAHDPRRLDEVHSLLTDLRGEDEGGGRLPPGLLQVWPSIWAAREMLRS